jgi:multiple sugar transport system permease protein
LVRTGRREPAGAAQVRQKRVLGLRSRHWMAVLFMAPAFIAIFATLIYPLAYNAWLSLHRFNLTRLYEGQRFVGLNNYLTALGDPNLWNALKNSLLLTFGGLLIEIPVGFALALALSQRVRGRRFFQFAILLPLLLVPAVAGFMWRFIFQYEGVGNFVLETLGLGRVDWSTTEMGLLSVIILVTWQNTPFALIVLLAGLQSIDPDIDAAAQIDGAGLGRRLWHITLPLMKPFILLVLVIRTMDLLRVFDEGYILTGGGPGRTTETLSQLVYTNTFTFFEIGRGATLSIIQTAIIVLFVVGYFLVLHRGSDRARVA